MKRVQKSGEETAEKGENLGEKLGRVGKRGGHATPTASFWRNYISKDFIGAEAQSGGCGGDSRQVKDIIYSCNNNIVQDNPFLIPTVSARKLAATLWELHHYKLPLAKMHHGGVDGPPPRLRRRNQHHHLVYRNKGGVEPLDPGPGLPELPGSSSSLTRHVAASLTQHHRSMDRSNHALQPISPASYSSSMELAPYNPAVTPTNSIELKGKIGETSYSLRTSTELLKVLNRIWSLEEQHVANTSLVKGMKKELDQACLRIKELTREQQSERYEMAELMKQISEGKFLRKTKEPDGINASVRSVRAELEEERKLRKRSESLHRRLARELYDVKMTLASVSKELEKEKKSSILLEDLCDEFAWGIRDYEKELHALRHNSDKDWGKRADRGQLILHVSEAWLDERMQMKLENGNGVGEKKLAVHRLSSEIETFLEMKRNLNAKINGKQVMRDRALRSSLESIPLNMAVSAPRDEEFEDDSVGSDSNCFELEKVNESNLKPNGKEQQEENRCGEAGKQKELKKKMGSSEKASGPSHLQEKFEEQMAQALAHSERVKGVEDINLVGLGKPVETNISQKATDKYEATKENNLERKYEAEGISGLNSNYMIDNLIRNHYLLSENGNTQQDKDHGAASSVWRSHPSPVRQWTEKLPSHDLELSSSSKLPADLKENTLKAKLYEARARGQRSRSRGKASIIPPGNE